MRHLRDRLTIQAAGLRPEPTAPVLGGLTDASVGRRLTAAAKAAGIEGRITGHSGGPRPDGTSGHHKRTLPAPIGQPFCRRPPDRQQQPWRKRLALPGFPGPVSAGRSA